MNNIKARLIEFVDYKGISKRKFCNNIEVSATFLANDSDITVDKVIKILTVYPEININWLIMGQGLMVIDDQRVKQLADDYARTVMETQQKMDDLGYFDDIDAGKKKPVKAETEGNEARLWGMVESLQRQIETMQETIKTQADALKELSSKGDAAGAAGAAGMAAQR